MTTYNPKLVTVTFGNHIVTGYAEDSFISIESNSDGVSKKVGCDGEVVRSISPDETYTIKLVLLYGSKSNKFLQQKQARDIKDGKGMFSVTINDKIGRAVFTAPQAWAVRPAARSYGREAGNNEWEIHTGAASFTQK